MVGSNSNFQDAHEHHDDGAARTSSPNNYTRRPSSARQARFAQSGMGERPLGFKLVHYAKKMSRMSRCSDGQLLGGGGDGTSMRLAAASERLPLNENSGLMVDYRSPSMLIPDGANEEEEEEDPEETLWDVLKEIIFGKLVSVFLLGIPFCYLAKYLQWGDVT